MHLIRYSCGLIALMVFNGCLGGGNPLSSERFVEVDFPLNKTCIYASAFIWSTEDSVHLESLHIFSLRFTEKIEADNEIEYTGNVGSYIPPEKLSVHGPDFLAAVTGDIHVTIKDNWVLYQHSDVYEAFNMFIKGVTDTMEIPTKYHNQFPSYPQKIIPFTSYAAFRPENSGADWGYVGVYRDFFSRDFRDWSTNYSQYRGLFLSGTHQLLGSTIETDMIVDEGGIVISQLSYGESVLTNERGLPQQTVDSYLITQRLVDFTDQQYLSPLQVYADEIMARGVNFLNR